jgi:hypothetical protein
MTSGSKLECFRSFLDHTTSNRHNLKYRNPETSLGDNHLGLDKEPGRRVSFRILPIDCLWKAASLTLGLYLRQQGDVRIIIAFIYRYLM